MELTLTKEQLDMRAFVQSFANQEIKPNVPAMEQDHFPTEIVEKMGIQGLMGIPIPEEYDGLGKDFISYIICTYFCWNKSYFKFRNKCAKRNVYPKASKRKLSRSICINRATCRFRCR